MKGNFLRRFYLFFARTFPKYRGESNRKFTPIYLNKSLGFYRSIFQSKFYGRYETICSYCLSRYCGFGCLFYVCSKGVENFRL